ncbi:MAG: OpgC domain-containing protein [Pseudomonadota bacterium]
MNATAAPPPPKPRDLRLDFFRGIAMFIIFTAHTPGNIWTLWIPARWGFSDATEIFVFCSGMASAIAFGAVFADRSWWLGTARIAHRVWQVYWAHVVVFIVIAAMSVTFDRVLGTDGTYVGKLNLFPFFNDPMPQLVGLLTLTYVPNYFDILPMYLVILAMVPVIMALQSVDLRLAIAFSVGLWALVSQPWLAVLDVPVFTALNPPAAPFSDRITWFFNPFCWQLIFFTGFAFMRGWLKPPPVRTWLIVLSAAFLVFAFFVDRDGVPARRLYEAVPALAPLQAMVQVIQGEIGPLLSKTFFGLFRFVHFLALAYLAWIIVGEGGRRLAGGGLWGHFVAIVRKVGQQSLATFLAGLVLARFMGMVLDLMGRTVLTTAAANLTGYAILIGVAYLVGWYKSTPWKRRQPKPMAPSAPPARANAVPAE